MSIKKYFDWAASPKIFHYTCLWLIVLVVVGTIAQKSMGLHLAQEKYFSSWLLLALGIPLPGGRLTMTLMFINMLCKTLFRTQWSWKLSGIFVTHLGVLLLLGGGFITAYFSVEGSMVIPEGQSSNYYSDSYQRELVLISEDTTLSFSEEELRSGSALTKSTLPAVFTVTHYFQNIDIRALVEERGAPYRDIAQKVLIAEKAVAPDGANLHGAIVEVSGTGGEEDGTYIFFENMLAEQDIVIGGTRYLISLRRRQYPLDFALELIDFKKEVHPGTAMASSYSSTVILKDGDVQLTQLIRMNEPLRHKGYTFYQSSFRQDDTGETTILAVVKNYGRTFPYISSIIICIGLLMHMFIMLPSLVSKLRNSAVLLGFIVLIAAPAQANDLSRVVIQDGGRLKPLDTYARTLLKTVSEKSTYQRRPAIEWLTDLMLHPERAYSQKVFTVRTPAVIKALGLKVDATSRYSFAQLRAAMASIMPQLRTIQEKERRSLVENQLLGLYSKLHSFEEAGNALTGLLPRLRVEDSSLAAALDLPLNQPLAYSDFVVRRQKVGQLIADLEAAGKKIEDDPALAALIAELNAIAAAPQPQGLRIFPDDHGPWLSPWEALGGHIHDYQRPLLQQFSKIVALMAAGHNAQAEIDAFVAAVGNDATIGAELTYNRADFFYWSLVLYIFAFIAVALSWMFWQKPLARIALGSTWLGCILHGLGMVYRYMIMGRPPVANLYESIVFVAFTAVAICLFLEYRRRDSIGLMGAAVSGAVVQFIARRYALDGDTMGMLVAVLDSNFWLATHVVTITIGYGATFVAAVIAHAYVIKVIAAPRESEVLKGLFANCMGIALVALFFTTLGTILGGIWADQSWGRFWGWDPKENGALLIVLCQVLLIHGRFSGHIKDLGFATGLGLCSIAVVLAWFGVNLLNVGLHNYGFDSGVARGVFLFCALETVFALLTYWIAKRRMAEECAA